MRKILIAHDGGMEKQEMYTLILNNVQERKSKGQHRQGEGEFRGISF